MGKGGFPADPYRKLGFALAKLNYARRYTMEHVPFWAKEFKTPPFPAPHYATDREWYENTIFEGQREYIKCDERCNSSNYSWPLGKFLDEPYINPNEKPKKPKIKKLKKKTLQNTIEELTKFFEMIEKKSDK